MEEQSPQFIAVVDSGGFVGAFATVEAAHAALAPFPPRPYAASAYPRRCPEGSSVWVLPYIWLSPVAIACISDDREVVAVAQTALRPLGLVEADDVDFWEQPFGEVAPAALRRLQEPQGDDPERLEEALFAPPGGPRAGGGPDPALERLKINLLESVVTAPRPVAVPPPRRDPRPRRRTSKNGRGPKLRR